MRRVGWLAQAQLGELHFQLSPSPAIASERALRAFVREEASGHVRKLFMDLTKAVPPPDGAGATNLFDGRGSSAMISGPVSGFRGDEFLRGAVDGRSGHWPCLSGDIPHRQQNTG